VRPVLTLIGDKGFAGQEFEGLVTTGFVQPPTSSDARV